MTLTVDDFLRNVLRSELLPREQLQSVLRKVPREQRGITQAVADFLVSEHHLTSFQATKLLANVVVGLKMGPYLIQTPIGKGGMGTVYLARDSRDGTMVAIKVVSPQRAKEGARHLARFQRETMMSQKLKHSNVALTREVGEFKGVHYLVLEYIPGVTLHRLVVRDGPLAVPRAARLFGEICAALEHAHEQGLIHRDLKPTNIMVTPDNHAKLLDLGLALMIGEEQEDPEIVGGKGYVVGSVDYIAPEQTRDSTQVDARADLYSLGCSLYFALTGRAPFPQGNSKEKMLAHRHQEPEPIRNRNPRVPEGFAEVVHRLMAKKPEQRPASAAQVRGDLAPWSEGEASPTDTESLVRFEVVGEDIRFEDHDTLSEVFKFTEPSGRSNRVSVRGLFGADETMRLMLWLAAGAAALVVLVMLIFALIRKLQ